MSTIGSPTYRLAKELAGILTPLAGSTRSFIKNSAHFVERIRELDLEKDDCLVSFDVVSLFTKVPVDEAIAEISRRLKEDGDLIDRTPIPADDICSLVELCLKSTYFQFGSEFYEQIEGAAMGSPLSPIVVNIYMEHFEKTALDSAQLRPKLWTRYVDDTFVVWPHGRTTLNPFLDQALVY